MRLTYNWLRSVAETKGFVFEKGDNSKYQLWSNEFALGVIADYQTLEEAWSDIYDLQEGRNPLSSMSLK